MKKVLIVDGDLQTRKLAAAGLRKSNLHILEAETAVEGLRLAKAEQPDLVVMGTHLEAHLADGLDLLRQLREDRSTSGCLVLLLAEPRAPIEFHPATAEAVDVVKKPFSPIDLRKRIEVLLAL